MHIITSRYPVEYTRSFVLGGKKIFRSEEGNGIRGGKKKKTKKWETEGEKLQREVEKNN